MIRIALIFPSSETKKIPIKGDRGTNICPQGSQLLNIEEDCKNGALRLGMGFAATGNWSGSPKGCLTSEWDGRQVFFNKHPTGSVHPKQAPICKAGRVKSF